MIRNNKNLTVCFYKNSNDREPVRDWLLALDRSDCQTIGQDIKTVEFGWPIGMLVCKPLRNGLYEVRSNLQDGKISRVIFCITGNVMVLLHGFIKKTQATPAKELDLAIKRKKEVLK